MKKKYNRYVRYIENDSKAAFLYFLSLCEKNRANHLGAYAYYKNFFDRISAGLIDSVNSSRDLMELQEKLDGLIHQYAIQKGL